MASNIETMAFVVENDPSVESTFKGLIKSSIERSVRSSDSMVGPAYAVDVTVAALE